MKYISPIIDISVYFWYYVFMMMTPLQQVELFHLLFIRHLSEKIDKRHFVLKGGANLRFYFKSIRYSEDLDFDVQVVARDTLKKQVTKLLQSTQFIQTLAAQKLIISEITMPKQTDTTQRWKLKVQGPASKLSIPTKVEFSRRGITDTIAYGQVDSEIVTAYFLYPILCQHYDLNASLQQKIIALAQRAETQARDIFDIDLLVREGAKLSENQKISGDTFTRAIENAISVSYSAYKAQVAAYLAAHFQEFFSSHSAWNDIQERVLAALEFYRVKAKP